jgi:putative PIN family toxin of toxin-antitoxin system
MRLVVLDTNVVVSAGIRPDGAPARLVADWVLEGQVQVVSCPWIVEEYRQVARRKKFAAYGFLPLWLEFLIEQSLYLTDPEPWPLPIPDPEDAPFLALARAAAAWLITGNLKHFPQKARDTVTALSPADYLSHLLADGKGRRSAR